MYNNDSDSLNAGAPDIRLSGNQQMAMSDESNTQLLESLYEEFLGMGFSPADAARKAQEAFDQMSQAPQQNSGIMAAAPGTYSQRRKQMMAGGGIAGLEKRQGYFLGDLVDKIKDDLIPNELKENPALTAALIGGGLNQFGLPDFLPDIGVFDDDFGQNWLGNLLGKIPGVPDDLDLVIGDTAAEKAKNLEMLGRVINPHEDTAPVMEQQRITDLLNKAREPSFLTKLGQTIMPGGETGFVDLYGTGGGGGGITSPYLGAEGSRRVNPLYPLGIGAAVGKYVEGLPKDELPMDTTSIDPAAIAAAARGTDAEGAAAGLRFLPEQVTRAAEGGRIGYREGEGVESIPTDQMQSIQGQQAGGEYNRVMELMLKIKENIPLTEDEQFELRELMKTLNMSEAPGRDRVMAQEGGLMDLGGMEKDYRNEGGFVALGGKEKADDVPARLSKNEFVFTADAVRGAGGGDIDKGAAIMEDLMNNLEGARGMFANAQKLQNRII